MLSGGSFQVLLLLILVICISIFFFFELRKINLKITSQDILIQKLTEDCNKLVEDNSKNELEMNNITRDINDSKVESQLDDIPDISGGFSPTTSKEPIYIKPENTLSEVLPLKNDTIKESEIISVDKLDFHIDESHKDSDEDSDEDSDKDSDKDSEDFDKDSEDSEDSELDIDEITKELQEMSVKELKQILQEKGLALSGNKTTMIERIINSLK